RGAHRGAGPHLLLGEPLHRDGLRAHARAAAAAADLAARRRDRRVDRGVTDLDRGPGGLEDSAGRNELLVLGGLPQRRLDVHVQVEIVAVHGSLLRAALQQILGAPGGASAGGPFGRAHHPALDARELLEELLRRELRVGEVLLELLADARIEVRARQLLVEALEETAQPALDELDLVAEAEELPLDL